MCLRMRKGEDREHRDTKYLEHDFVLFIKPVVTSHEKLHLNHCLLQIYCWFFKLTLTWRNGCELDTAWNGIWQFSLNSYFRLRCHCRHRRRSSFWLEIVHADEGVLHVVFEEGDQEHDANPGWHTQNLKGQFRRSESERKQLTFQTSTTWIWTAIN